VSDRPGRAEGGDSERLPWLEPYRQPIEGQRREATRSHGPLLAYAFGLLVLSAVGIGGYWLGQRESVAEQPKPEVRVAERIPPPEPFPEIAAAGREVAPPATEREAAPLASAAEASKPIEKAKPSVRQAQRPAAKKKIRHANTKRTQYDRVLAKQREAAKTWPKMPSPGPAGQVIQLGAFSNRTRAQNAYRERLARYPVLSGMPQVIVPVITQPRGDVLYVLRLGTQSREQSIVVCRNLRTSGDHCLVIG
jgi:hypothetical protein